MTKLIAYCGLDCMDCEAYWATQKDDKEEYVRIAAKWSKLYGGDVKPEDVICDGCTVDSDQKNAHYNNCNIRICAQDKGVENCADCDEYICKKLEEFFDMAPEAKENLEQL